MRRRLLLIDGPNVSHAWGGGVRTSGALARVSVARQAAVLADVEGWEVVVVWDSRGDQREVDPAAPEPVRILLAPADETADTVIERLATEAVAGGAEVRVATADRSEQATVEAAGAACFSPADLAAWVERATARVSRRTPQPAAEGLGGLFERARARIGRRRS